MGRAREVAQPLIDLSRNEPISGPPPHLFGELFDEVVRSAHRYPIDLHKEVEALVSEKFAIDAEEIVLTRGVDEAIDRVLEQFPERIPALLDYEFSGFHQRLEVHRRTPIRLPVADDFAFPTEASAGLDASHLWFVSTPNNPIGRDFEPRDLEQALDRGCIAFIDRAYRDFALDPGRHERSHENALRFYSFSKGFGMPSLRLGVLVGGASSLSAIRTRQWFCEIDTATLLLSRALLTRGTEWCCELVKQTQHARYGLVRSLRALGWDARDTETNFVVVRHSSATDIAEFLAQEHRVKVATTYPNGLPGYLRITVGDDTAHARLLDAIAAYVGAHRGRSGK